MSQVITHLLFNESKNLGFSCVSLCQVKQMWLSSWINLSWKPWHSKIKILFRSSQKTETTPVTTKTSPAYERMVWEWDACLFHRKARQITPRCLSRLTLLLFFLPFSEVTAAAPREDPGERRYQSWSFKLRLVFFAFKSWPIWPKFWWTFDLGSGQISATSVDRRPRWRNFWRQFTPA